MLPTLTSPLSPFVKIGDIYLQSVLKDNSIAYQSLFKKLSATTCFNYLTNSEEKIVAYPSATLVSKDVLNEIIN